MNPDSKISVVYCGDNILSKEGISFLINCTPQLNLIGTYESSEMLEENIQCDLPDVVLLEIGQSRDRIKLISFIREMSPQSKIIILSSIEEQVYIVRALRYGIDGYVLNTSSPIEIIKSITEVYFGETSFSPGIIKLIMQYFRSTNKPAETYILTKREEEIVNGLSKGYSYKMIADHMGIKLDTVRSHIRRVYDKMDVNSRTQVILKTLENNK